MLVAARSKNQSLRRGQSYTALANVQPLRPDQRTEAATAAAAATCLDSNNIAYWRAVLLGAGRLVRLRWHEAPIIWLVSTHSSEQ